jgi:hypothetical protein
MNANVIPTYATMALVLMQLDLTSVTAIQASSLATTMTALVYVPISFTINDTIESFVGLLTCSSYA